MNTTHTTQLKSTEMSHLQRRCYGRNLINKLTIENISFVLPQLEKFKGKKIRVANEALSKNFTIELLKVPYNETNCESFRTYLKFHGQRLYLFQDITVADTAYNGGGFGVSYYKNEVQIAKVDADGLLIEIDLLEPTINAYELSKVYEVAEVEALKNELQALNDRKYNIERILRQVEKQ